LEIQFIGQPVSAQIGTHLIHALQDMQVTHARFLVAWGKYSGLRRIEKALTAARERGVDVEVVVGVDEGGATVQGLDALLKLTDRAFVFHNPARPKRTFHPKVYLLDGTHSSMGIVGSGNLTSGGLFGNYEAATVVRVLNEEAELSEGKKFLSEASSFYETIRDDPESTRCLDEDLIRSLREHKTILIGDEGSRPSRKEEGSGAEEIGDTGNGLFGKSSTLLLSIPKVGLAAAGTGTGGALPQPLLTTDEDDNDDGVALETHLDQVEATEAEADAGEILTGGRAGFFKRLSNNDVSLTSSPGQMIIPIRFLEFFEPLENQGDRVSKPGAVQRGREDIPTTYHDGDTERELKARVIYYKPAPDHPRQNTDIRFALHDRETLLSLRAGDYLEFAWDETNRLHVWRSTEPRAAGYGWVGA
jgi:HKD family nuclease